MANTRLGPATVATMYPTYEAAQAASRERAAIRNAEAAKRHRGQVFKTLLGGAALFGGGAALGGLLGGGAATASQAAPAATGGGFWSGVSAPTFGASQVAPAVGAGVSGVAPTAAKFTLGNILRMAEIGVPAVTGLFGMRSQNRALDKQAAAEQAALAEQMAFARESEAQRRAEADRMFVEDQRRWEAEERNRAREIAAAEEERAFQRRLVEEQEARLAPLRAASGPALVRLQQLMAMGRRR